MQGLQHLCVASALDIQGPNRSMSAHHGSSLHNHCIRWLCKSLPCKCSSNCMQGLAAMAVANVVDAAHSIVFKAGGVLLVLKEALCVLNELQDMSLV